MKKERKTDTVINVSDKHCGEAQDFSLCLTELEKEVLKIFVYKNCNLSAVARKLNYSTTAIYHFFYKIRDKTGYNPLNFIDLVLLLNKLGYDFVKLHSEGGGY